MSAKITKDVQVPTGLVPGDAKKVEYLRVGFVTEEDFGQGNVRRRTWLHTSVLNPVLFQQVKPFLGGSSYVCLGTVDLARRKAGPETPGLATDPDEYPQEGELYAGN